jgi:hypothetical protein
MSLWACSEVEAAQSLYLVRHQRKKEDVVMTERGVAFEFRGTVIEPIDFIPTYEDRIYTSFRNERSGHMTNICLTHDHLTWSYDRLVFSPDHSYDWPCH